MAIVAVCLIAILVPGIVGAATWQVDPGGAGDFTTIQAAIDNAAAGDLITVAPGHYVEQLTITTDNLTISGAGRTLTFVDSPAQLTNYFIVGSYYFPVVLVENCVGVGFADLTLDGLGRGDTNPLFQGFGYFNAGGWLDNVAITGVRGATLNAMPHGNGIFVVATDLVSRTFDLTDVQVTDFQKSGVVLDGTNLGGTLLRATVTGAGTTGTIAQNGFQVSRDAAFTLTDCVASGLMYTGGIWTATGFLGTGGTNIDLTGCQADGCQTGVYMEDNTATFANGAVVNALGDGIVSASTGAKALTDRLVPQPVTIVAAKAGTDKAAAGLAVTNSVITGTDGPDTWGVSAVAAGPVSLTMDNCTVTRFERGFVIMEDGGAITGQARGCSFIDNLALAGWSNSVLDYDALGNWWGHLTGPYHAVKNPAGLGFEITDHILFDPWAILGPGIVAAVPGPDPVRCGVPRPVTVTYYPDPAGAPTRGYEITFRVVGPATVAAADVVDAGGLGSVGSHQFYAADNGDGTVTVSDALLGPTPGLTATVDVFTVDVQTTGDGPVTFEFVSYKLRDLDNAPLYAPVLGTMFNVDCVAPAPVTALTASPAHNRVDVTWSHDDVDVDHYEVFRGLWHDGTVGQSAYPEYDDVAPATPAVRPATWAVAMADPEWELAGTTAVGTHVFADTWPDATSRGVYSYEVFAVDPVFNGNAAPANDRATNYWLGDVAGTPGDNSPNGVVDVFDISALGTHFGDSVPLHDPINVLDVGPTDDHSRLGVPGTDNVINFEDLIIFSMNFGVVAAAKDRAPVSATVDLAWIDNQDGTMTLRLVGGSGLKGLRVQSGRAVKAVTGGALLAEQAAPAFFRNVGEGLDANLAVLGVNAGFSGEGDLLVVALDGPLPATELTITARGLDNSRLEVNLDKASSNALPQAFGLRANYPNPFNPATTITYALPEAQRVELAVYGLDGRRVVTLVAGRQAAGVHDVVWHGRDSGERPVAAGTYFYRIHAGPYHEVRKMILVK